MGDGAPRKATGASAPNTPAAGSERASPLAPLGAVWAFGVAKSASGWVRDPRCVVSRTTLVRRLRSGLAPEEAITLPPGAAGASRGGPGGCPSGDTRGGPCGDVRGRRCSACVDTYHQYQRELAAAAATKAIGANLGTVLRDYRRGRITIKAIAERYGVRQSAVSMLLRTRHAEKPADGRRQREQTRREARRRAQMAILEALRDGAPSVSVAAKEAGVGPSTCATWMAQEAWFDDAVTRARASSAADERALAGMVARGHSAIDAAARLSRSLAWLDRVGMRLPVPPRGPGSPRPH